jgi:hypothetical protein
VNPKQEKLSPTHEMEIYNNQEYLTKGQTPAKRSEYSPVRVKTAEPGHGKKK